MKKLLRAEYEDYARLNPEIVALIQKQGESIFLISDMEFAGDSQLLRVESMFFELDKALSFTTSIVECRGRYAGGITFPIERCASFEEAFSVFIQQSSSKNFWLIDNKSWKDIIDADFFEAFIAIEN